MSIKINKKKAKGARKKVKKLRVVYETQYIKQKYYSLFI